MVDVATRAAVPNTSYQGKSVRVQNACIWWPSDKSLGIPSYVVVTIEPTAKTEKLLLNLCGSRMGPNPFTLKEDT